METGIFVPGPYTGPLPQLQDRHFDVVHITPDWLTTEKIRSGSGGLGVVSGVHSIGFEKHFERFGINQLTFAFHCTHGYQTQMVENGNMVPRYTPDPNPEWTEDTGYRIKLIFDGKPCYVAIRQPRDIERNHTAVILLDTDIEENNKHPNFRLITRVLYGEKDAIASFGVPWHDVNYMRVWQNAVLGLGAYYAIKELGITYDLVHFNDSHGIFFALHQWGNYVKDGMQEEEALERVNKEVRYTNHTVVEAGNRHYPYHVILDILREHYAGFEKRMFQWLDPKPPIMHELHMTNIAMRFAGKNRHVCGVSKRHAEIVEKLWPGYNVFSITNSVPEAHTHPEALLLDGPHQIPDFKEYVLYGEGGLIDNLVERARKAGYKLKPNVAQMRELRTTVIGSARRAAEYKRSGMLFHEAELDFVRKLHEMGQVAIAWGGYAHGDDWNMVQEWNNRLQTMQTLPNSLPVFNYDYELMMLMKAGSHIWVSSPYPDQEACSTSPMSALKDFALVVSVLHAGFIPEAEKYVVIFGDRSPPPEEPGKVRDDKNRRYQHDAHDLWRLLNEYQVLIRKKDPRVLDLRWEAAQFAREQYSTERVLADYCEKLYRLPR